MHHKFYISAYIIVNSNKQLITKYVNAYIIQIYSISLPITIWNVSVELFSFYRNVLIMYQSFVLSADMILYSISINKLCISFKTWNCYELTFKLIRFSWRIIKKITSVA